MSTPNRAQQSRDPGFLLDPSEVEVEERDSSTGAKTRATYYEDGSSTRDFGAMTGIVDYNEYGEEC